jgi:hypothetical protein
MSMIGSAAVAPRAICAVATAAAALMRNSRREIERGEFIAPSFMANRVAMESAEMGAA